MNALKCIDETSAPQYTKEMSVPLCSNKMSAPQYTDEIVLMK